MPSTVLVEINAPGSMSTFTAVSGQSGKANWIWPYTLDYGLAQPVRQQLNPIGLVCRKMLMLCVVMQCGISGYGECAPSLPGFWVRRRVGESHGRGGG